MPYCPSVCYYRVVFSDGTIRYPRLPGYVDVYDVAERYARETLSKGNDSSVTVVSIEQIR